MSPSFDLDALKAAIQNYEAMRLSLQDLKASILAAADRVTEYERAPLRRRLVEIEGRLDIIEFTTDAACVYAATLPVLAMLKAAMQGSEG